MQQYKVDFVHFLVETGALKFGSFVLKSGRTAPYFLNAGQFFTGEQLTRLGSFYAEAFKEANFDADVLFGPAYKGIPLSVIATSNLYSKFSINLSYCFNRKEAKNYGDAKGNMLVGAPLSADSKVVLIDDVITAGTAIRETVTLLKENGDPQIKGVLIMLDRMEKTNEGTSAVQEIESSLAVKVVSIVTLDEMIEILYNKPVNGVMHIDDEKMSQISDYRREYGI